MSNAMRIGNIIIIIIIIYNIIFFLAIINDMKTLWHLSNASHSILASYVQEFS